MVFLKMVHSESQVNHKTQLFWVKVVHPIPNVQTLAALAVDTIHLVAGQAELQGLEISLKLYKLSKL